MRLRADGRHLRAGPRGAGEAGLCGQRADLQALCGDCHRESAAHQPGEPRGPASWSTSGAPSCLLWFLTCAKDSTWTWCCRRNGLANAPPAHPVPGGRRSARGRLGFVEGCCDARQSCLNLLPYVGPGWYPKVSLAAMLDLGVCRWDHIVLGISARSRVDAATLRRALERMDAAWSKGKERMAKLSVNAMIGLWARSTEVVYSVRSSSSELDGAGADFSQAFAHKGGMVWDFVYARRLLSNGTYRPIHDVVLGFEHATWRR